MTDSNVTTGGGAGTAGGAGGAAAAAAAAEEAAAGGTTSNGTAARLCTMHKNPNTDPTPGANYGAHTPTELANALKEQAAYACRKWQARSGVVGLNGLENVWGFKKYNNPADSMYEQYQAYGYQHDLQAIDADLQHTSQNQEQYTEALQISAREGMSVLKSTRDVNQALKKAQEVWRSYGFTVRQSY